MTAPRSKPKTLQQKHPMKTPANTLTRTFALTGLAVALATVSATAAPTEELDGGQTSVELSSTLVGALNSLNVELRDISPGRVQRGRATFPVESGAVDLDNLAGEIVHEGGLQLRAGNTRVELIDFVIDTTGEQIVLTGLVILNDSLVGRIPLFNVALTSDAELLRNGVRIPGAALTLTSEAASALNTSFAVTAFTAGLDIGSATVTARLD
jgi:hypothetical protein